MSEENHSSTFQRAWALHSRNWRANRYVYPVCSRRSRGISIGVNLNPDKVCNYDCVYCQVDRTEMGGPRDVDVDLLRAELGDMLARVRTGAIYDEPEFVDLPENLRRLNDIAFSGDGEPTTCPQFVQAVALSDELANDPAAADDQRPKLVLITNATMFSRPRVREGLDALHRHRGEIWGKLDAGTQDYYNTVERTSVPLSRVMENLCWAAACWPIVIQSLFMRLDGQGPDAAEIEAYCDRLAEIRQAGTIKLVQVYTVARPPAEHFVTPLSRSQVDAIGQRVRTRLADTPVECFYGPE